MRITSGLARGTQLKVPANITRPTSDRVKESLFSILGGRLEDLAVLDLFAGSGALGLEALSRGASKAILVESHPAAIKIIQANLEKTKLAGAQVLKLDVFKAIELLNRQKARFDVIFADPPYTKTALMTDFALKLLEDSSLPEMLTEQGCLVIECPSDYELPEEGDWQQWELIDERVYGSTALLIFQPALEEEDAAPESDEA